MGYTVTNSVYIIVKVILFKTFQTYWYIMNDLTE